MIRRLGRRMVVAALGGAVVAGSTFAGAAVRTALDDWRTADAPVDAVPSAAAVLAAAGVDGAVAGTSSGLTPGMVELAPEAIPAVAAAEVRAPSGGRTPAGTFLVGAARASLAPAPRSFGGETWRTEGCSVLDGGFDPAALTDDLTHLLPDLAASPGPDGVVDLLDEVRSWPASPPDCVYLGGFGLGPLRYAQGVGHGGVWVRALAISNGEDTYLYGIADTVGWFANYDATICDDCGIRDVRERLAGDLGLDVGDVVMGSTHTHAGADTFGGWGGIPDWYRAQLRDAAIAAAKQAVANLQPATIDVGEAHLRDASNERRDTYYSTVDTGATWLQARALPVEPCDPADAPGPGNGDRRRAETAAPARPRCGEAPVIATLATFAAHPTIVGSSVLHADWPGAAARHFETVYGGGVGLLFEGGLGNASVSTKGSGTDEQRAEATGVALAERIAADIADRPHRLRSNDMQAAASDITHPALVSNPALVTLATVGLFDRAFLPGTDGTGAPGVYRWSKRGELSTAGEDNDPEADAGLLRGCTSAGPSIVTTAGAHRIGDFVVAFTPGEIFSNVAEVVKERADASAVTMVLGQANDALGYLIQSFEFDSVANLATHYAAGLGEYEEVFAVDRCLGDHVLETVLESTAAVGAGR